MPSSIKTRRTYYDLSIADYITRIGRLYGDQIRFLSAL